MTDIRDPMDPIAQEQEELPLKVEITNQKEEKSEPSPYDSYDTLEYDLPEIHSNESTEFDLNDG